MDNALPVFRSWAPEWLIRGTLFLLILPSIVLFFLSLANINAAAGYYGGEPADIQFAVALFYAVMWAFTAWSAGFLLTSPAASTLSCLPSCSCLPVLPVIIATNCIFFSHTVYTGYVICLHSKPVPDPDVYPPA